MAELLKRQHDLIVLKVELRSTSASEDADVAVFTLQGKVDGELRDMDQRLLPIARQDLERVLEPTGNGRFDVALPNDFLAWVLEGMEAVNHEGRPLWVHLVKPYGALRFVPWERVLGRALSIPVLMLPDFIFPRPREAPGRLEVALCGSAPLGVEAGGIEEALYRTLSAIRHGSPRRTRVHLFTDAMLLTSLMNAFQGEIAEGWLVPHNPGLASRFVVRDPEQRELDSSGRLRSPWLLWMRDALREQAIDVVHFCCHGHLSRGRGALLFAQSPLARTKEYLAGPVGSAELQTFMTQVGAWSNAFTAPRDNHSEAGLRGLADEMAQLRPGPMFMVNLRENPGEVLRQAYTFVYAPVAQTPPTTPALFIYCQPYLVASAFNETPERPLALSPTPRSLSSHMVPVLRNALQYSQVVAATAPAPTDRLYTGQFSPTWLAATERFADDLELRNQALARDALLSDEQTRQFLQTQETILGELRKAVASLAKDQDRDQELGGRKLEKGA